MRAAVLSGPGELRVAEVELPEPGAGQVRVRLEGCGVCASNLTPWAGAEWMQYPLEPGAMGHEGWGVVDALGEGVTGVQVGDRVAALSYKSYAEYDVAAADAYGVRQDGLTQRVPKKHFKDVRLHPGMQAVLPTNFGPRAVTILKVGMSVVDVDLNHPMAGKDLSFAIELVEVREASAEEIEHGHVHGEGGHQH
ncbi:MAG: alcohol dehydrogenase catalytic domain-containing protein [Proteobacteria bacterium]|nr:alcohol dehydrogenase catalytic domain-containing protein [Pseudomonadota bacterium]